MKKNNFLLLISALLAFSGCSKSPPSSLLISKWDKQNGKVEPIIERKLASGSLRQGQCLKDVYSVDTIKAQIKEMERQYSNGHPVTGTWKHLNLADLPIPQANFLKTFGSKLGNLSDPNSIDFRECEDVPCIFNRIYGRRKSTAGYIHYLWYLKFGSLLAADNLVPSQKSPDAGTFNGKSIPFQNYLFKDRELYAFYRLSLMLKTPYTSLRRLSEIQRIPHEEKFEQADFLFACGLAYSQGWITLTDSCLVVRDNDLDNGFAYSAITHELSHHVDFELARGDGQLYRSHKSDYLAFTDLFREEWVDDKGTKRQWRASETGQYITEYSKITPQENFAESLTYFRLDGDMAKRQMTQAHNEFISQNFHDNKYFDKTSILRHLLSAYESETTKEVFKAVLDCSESKAKIQSSYFTASDFSYPLMSSMLNCLGSKAVEIESMLKSQIAIREAEGCSSLNEFPGKSEWPKLVKAHLIKFLSIHLEELNKDKNYLARIQNYYDEVSNSEVAQNAFVFCYGTRNEEDCFNSEVKRLSLEKAMSLRLPEAQTKEMSDMYVSYHSYRRTKDATLRSYQTFVASNLELIRSEASDIWKSCRDMSHNDDQSPSGLHFQIGDSYLISSLYNCVNAQIPSSVIQLLQRLHVEGVQVSSSNEEKILKNEIRPHLSNFLRAHYDFEKSLEKRRAEEFISEDGGTLRRQITANFSWVKNISDPTGDCKNEAYRLISFSPLYALKKELFGQYVENNTCSNIMASKEMKSWIESSSGELTQGFLQGISGRLVDRGSDRARVCVGQFPVNSVTNRLRFRKQREDCLLNEWEKIEQGVFEEAMRDPVVIKFQIAPNEIKSRIEGNRRRHQIQIIREYFQ